MRCSLLAAAAVAAAGLLTPAAARADSRVEGAFRRADNAVFCSTTYVEYVWTAFTCYRPSDGRFMRFESGDLTDTTRPRVVVGTDPALVGAVDPSVNPVRVGRTWLSSDAALVACRVTRTGVRCHHWLGPGFELGAVAGEQQFATRRPRRNTSVP